MLPILGCLYGLAGFLCLLGYLYALMEWHLRQRSLEWTERLPITATATGSNEVRKEQTFSTSESPCLDGVVPLPLPSKSSAYQNDPCRIENELIKPESVLRSIEANPCEQMNPDQIDSESESNLSSQQVSWEHRRVERRQRYKAEKCRLRQNPDEERDEREVSQAGQDLGANLDRLQEWIPEAPNTDAEIQQAFEEYAVQLRKYSIPEEIRLAHSMCSRRASVQVTDLDDHLRAAASHIKEHGYDLSESTAA